MLIEARRLFADIGFRTGGGRSQAGDWPSSSGFHPARFWTFVKLLLRCIGVVRTRDRTAEPHAVVRKASFPASRGCSRAAHAPSAILASTSSTSRQRNSAISFTGLRRLELKIRVTKDIAGEHACADRQGHPGQQNPVSGADRKRGRARSEGIAQSATSILLMSSRSAAI
jgi:hypothetical protein